ncbi:MAG: enoyl-ACP reductase [Alphaproteobacteria bacterium]|nr:enoyl-ACP reductase [Alphaproteobacteria bacterium]
MMKNKVGLVMGMANEYSIAYGISKSLINNGANILFTAQSDRFKQKITDMEEFKNNKVFICDVSDDNNIEQLFSSIKQEYGSIDFIVHSIAFSDRKELQGKYYNTSRSNFLNAMDISCYSLTKVCQYASSVMNNGGSIVTLTYYGSEKTVPNYNVMGVVKAALESSVRYLASDLGEFNIRVNAVSAGPIKTLASSGVGEFSKVLDYEKNRSPLQRNITKEEVGNVCTFLLSEFSSGITGEIIHVDCGCNTVGIKF